jgi:hypothetical protein
MPLYELKNELKSNDRIQRQVAAENRAKIEAAIQ